MVKVITYGTYDLLHYGHIRLLERAKSLGDYLIVGVTADDFDKTRGKINVQQSLIERVEAIRNTGLADEIIIEEYEGQKIDDIQKYGIDIFTVGSDWKGTFDYLSEYCRVVYLDRTEGISSSMIRTKENSVRLGLIGEPSLITKVAAESKYINGLEISGCFSHNDSLQLYNRQDTFDDLIKISDALYIISEPCTHYEYVKRAITKKKHVLCESPVTLNLKQKKELNIFAKNNGCVLMDAIKTAYSTAYSRMILLAKSGKIGDIVSIDATATTLRDIERIRHGDTKYMWDSITEWGPTVMLPVFQLLGTDYREKRIFSRKADDVFDLFTKVNFTYDNAVATIKAGKGVKSEGDLIISGTAGYIYVPAPWWNTDYFEIRYENPADNKRFFYQLDGEGIRYELLTFVNSIKNRNNKGGISEDISDAICGVMEDFYNSSEYSNSSLCLQPEKKAEDI